MKEHVDIESDSETTKKMKLKLSEGTFKSVSCSFSCKDVVTVVEELMLVIAVMMEAEIMMIAMMSEMMIAMMSEMMIAMSVEVMIEIMIDSKFSLDLVVMLMVQPGCPALLLQLQANGRTWRRVQPDVPCSSHLTDPSASEDDDVEEEEDEDHDAKTSNAENVRGASLLELFFMIPRRSRTSRTESRRFVT